MIITLINQTRIRHEEARESVASNALRVTASTLFVLLGTLIAAMAVSRDAHAQSECAPNWELDGELCYPPCAADFNGVGPVCWHNCPPDYADDGATCRRDADIFGADNGECPWYDKCGLTFAQGCSTCPEGYANDGCTCRRDVHIFGKETSTRGAGTPRRAAFRTAFADFVGVHRAGAAASATSLTEEERAFLVQFFPQRLVEQVKIIEVPGMTLPFFKDAGATTIGNDLIVIQSGHRSNQLLKHELVHVCQYDNLGFDDFMRQYADQYVDGGYSYNGIVLEQQAFDFERNGSGPVARSLGYCS